MAKANQAVQPSEVVVSAVPAQTKEQVAATQKAKLTELVAKYGTKSQMIRALAGEGMQRKDIAKLTGIRYQHVRNVLITPIKNPKVAVEAEPAPAQA